MTEGTLSIEDWTSAQTQFRPPFTDELIGRRFELHGPGGARLELEFIDAHSLRRSPMGDELEPVELRYDASTVRPGIYLVDFLDASWPFAGAVPTYARLITWALDINSGRATVAVSGVIATEHPGQGALLRARTEHQFWSTDAGAKAHPASRGLVGNRVRWRYSDTDEYEHTYMSTEAFAWQCLRGVERGLSELDPTRTFEIADGLYFFHWAEQQLVVDTALLIDLHQLRTWGRFYVLDDKDAALHHHQFGARGDLLGKVDYGEAGVSDPV